MSSRSRGTVYWPRGKGILLAVGIIFTALITSAGVLLSTQGPTYYVSQDDTYFVSPDGSDANSGSQDRPWKTLARALKNLSAGDVLNLRGGTYYEHEITVGVKGTASSPITIQSYPGERAIVDGGVPYFMDAPNSEWELVNGSIQLYRSKRSFSGGEVRAWLVDADVQLIEYIASANLEATNYGPVKGKAPLYIGPGVQLRSDGRIYIRLQSNPQDLTDASGAPIPPMPADTDPNHNRIGVFTSEHIFLLNGAEYLKFKDIRFANSIRIMDVHYGSNNVELAGSRLDYGTYGLVIRDGIHGWDIHDNEFNNGLPDHVYWTDVKNGGKEVAEAYPEFQSAAIIGSVPNFKIENNIFRDTFDALDIYDGTSNTRIVGNTFKYVLDDAMELYRGIGNVEVAHNLLWHVGSGISIDPSNARPGPVYIHHNVIDNSAYQHGGRPGNYRASDWPVWTTIDPFSNHGSGNSAASWKLYNNTIVTRRSGYDWDGAGPAPVAGNPEKYVFNNIFYVIDDRIVFRDDQVSAGSHYDGNVIYRKAPGRYPLFYNFGNGKDYPSLAEFRRDSGTDWEAQGLEIDPGFSVTLIDDPSFDPATIWNRYLPSNSMVFSTGASYSGLGWPGTEGVSYRGAVARSTSTSTPAETPTVAPAPSSTPTRIATETATSMPTAVPSATATRTPTSMPTEMATGTPTPTSTPTSVVIETATSSPTETPARVPTGTPMPTGTPSFGSVTYAMDGFSRSVMDGWGSANVGGVYDLIGGASTDYRVNGSAGTMLDAKGGTRTAALSEVVAQDVDLKVRVQTSKMAIGDSQYVYVVARRERGVAEYRVHEYQGQIRFTRDGTIGLRAIQSDASLDTPLGTEVMVSGLNYMPASFVWVRVQVEGTSPTTIRMKAWADEEGEPTVWQYSVTNADPPLQQAGTVGVRTYVPWSSAVSPVLFSFDDLRITSP